MNIDKQVIIDNRTSASINETWTEYLCLRKLSEQNYELSIQRHRVLAEASQYRNKKMPKSIKGKIVKGIEHNQVIGKDLLMLEGKKAPIQFDHFSPHIAMQWLQQVDWFNKAVWSSLGTLVKAGK